MAVDLADSIGQAFGLDAPDLADSITSAFGLDEASPPPRPSPEGAKLLDAIDRQRLTNVRGWEPIETIPFVGGGLKAARLSTISGAANRIAGRKAREEDYDHVARFIVQEDRAGNQSGWESVLAGTLGSLGLGAELIATGGVAGGAEAIGGRVLGGNVVGRVASKGLGIAAQSAASTQPLAEAARYSMPQVGLGENADGELAPIIEQFGDDLPKALIKGFARHGLTVGVERVGGEALSKLPIVKQVQNRLGQAWMKLTGQGPDGLAAKLAEKTGWNGLVSEVGEERMEEIIAGAMNLEDNFGLTGQAVSAAVGSPGDEAQAAANDSFWKNLGVELGTIVATGGVTKAVTSTPQFSESLGRLTNLGVEKLSRGEPLSRRDVNGQTSQQQRADIADEIKATMAAEADRIIKERPDAAWRLLTYVQDQPTAKPTVYQQAFGEPEPHPGYGRLLLDALQPRKAEIEAAAIQKRQAEYEKGQAEPEPRDARQRDYPSGFTRKEDETFSGYGNEYPPNTGGGSFGWLVDKDRFDAIDRFMSDKRTVARLKRASSATDDEKASIIEWLENEFPRRWARGAAKLRKELHNYGVKDDRARETLSALGFDVGIRPTRELYGELPGEEDIKINDLRRELTRAGIPKAKNATKDELAELHKGWIDELQKTADENEVGVDRLQHWLGVLYDREDQINQQYDHEIGGLLSEYRKRYGLNAQAMSKTDPGGSFSGKPFSDIANEFLGETQGRFDLKDADAVWELFKDGKLHRPTYRDLLDEAVEQAKGEADQFDPGEFGLPAEKPEKSRELKSGGDATAWDFDAVPLGGDPVTIVGEPPKLDLAGVRMMVRENPTEDFSPEGIASWIKQAAAPEMLSNYEKAVSKLDRWADKNAAPDDDNPNINGEHFEDHASRMLYAWMPSPQEMAQAISDEAQRFQAERRAKRAARRSGGDVQASPAETQAHPSVAKSASQLPWQYQGERVKKPQNSPAIIRQLVKATEALGRGLPIRVGRLGRRHGRRSAGWYNPKTHVSRVKLALDTATASHEVGHAVDRLLFGDRKRWPKNAAPPAVHADLVKLGQALYPQEPHNGWESEGFAELVFFYVHDKSKLDSVPALRDWFQTEVLDANPEFAKRLEAASKMGHQWVRQGAANRAAASMVDTGLGTGVQNLKRLYDQNRPHEVLVEALAPLDDLSKAAAQILGEKGKELPPSKDPFKLAKRLRLTAPAITRAMIDEGMVDRTGKIVGPSLRAGVRNIRRAEYRDFALYLWARRAIKVQASGRQAGISKKDAEQVVRDLENDRFKEAAEAVYKWTDGVLDYMASLSPDLAAGVDAIRAIDPGDYVPLQRLFEEFDETYRTSSVGSAASGSVTKRLRGSGRRVINPLESLISTTQERIEHAHQRAILESVLNTGLGVEHLGEFVEEVEPSKVPKAALTLQSLIEKARAHAGRFVDVPKGSEFKLIGKDGEEIDIEDALEEWITLWGQADNPTGPDPIFAVRKGGKTRWFYIKPRLAEALGQIQEAKFRNPAGQAIFNFIRSSNLVFKMGTTGLRAPFGVVINPIRDVQDLYQRTRSDASFARVAGNYLRAYFEELGSRLSGRAVESRESQLFRRLGLEMSQHLGRERAATRRASKGLFRTVTPGKAFDYAIDLLQFSDAAARIAEMRMVAKDKGIDIDNLTFDQAIDLAIAAKEATTDFSAGGRWTSFLNGLLPYFNAGVQGWAGGIRAAKRNPWRTLWRVGWKAGILASLWLQYKDDDWWKEMPSYEKWNYFHIPIKFGGRDEVLRIPLPQDTENVYTMGVLAILEAVNERDPAVAVEYAQHLMDTVTPTAPVLLQEGAEQAANRDFFTGKPIVSEKFRDTRPSEQFNEYTSGLAKWLGENTGLSPIRIDHAIRGVGGPLASDSTRVLTADGREKEPSDAPVVGTLFQRGGPLGYRPESVDQLYDRLQEAKYRHTDWRNATTPAEKDAAENEQQRQARLMVEDAAKAVTDLGYARSMTKSVTDRRKITAKMAEIARDAIANYDALTPNRARFKAEAKAAERVRAGAR